MVLGSLGWSSSKAVFFYTFPLSQVQRWPGPVGPGRPGILHLSGERRGSFRTVRSMGFSNGFLTGGVT